MEIKIEGLENTIAKLKELDGAVVSKLIPKANKAGAKVIKDVAIAIAPFKSGLLRDNIKIRNSNKPAKGLYSSYVGVNKKDWTGPAFYAAFVMWGHKAGSRKLGGGRKEVAGNDFLKKATEQAAQRAVQTNIDTLNAGIAKLAK
jgi:HK97 gp10 family phage protein